MSSPRRADARFVLPVPTRRAALLGDGWAWEPGLAVAGAGWRAHGPDVAPLAAGAEAVLVEGRAPRTPPGWHRQEWAVVLRRDEPLALAPAGDPVLLRRALEAWVPSTRAKAAGRTALRAAAATGRLPLLPRVTVLARGSTSPLAAQAAVRDAGVPADARPLVLTAGGSLRRRVATLLFPVGEREPAWVVKSERAPAGPGRAERERSVVDRVRRAGVPGVEVPAVLAVTTDPDHVASVEEAAAGGPLAALLTQDRAAARAALGRLAGWLTELAVATRAPAADPGPPSPGGQAAAARGLTSGVPRVLCHGDLLDGGNVLVHAGRLAVVDWETGDPAGDPLRDLLPVLACGLAVLRVGARPADVAAEVLRCASGRSPDSSVLLDAVHGHVRALGVDPDLLGPLAVLAWAHHARQPAEHRRLLAAQGLPEQQWDSIPERVAAGWAAEPGLGLHWPAAVSGRA